MLFSLVVKSAVDWNQLKSVMHSHGVKALDTSADSRPRPNYLNGVWLGDTIMSNGISYGIVREVHDKADVLEITLQDLYTLLQQIK